MPEQVSPQAPITWSAIHVSSGDALAVRASKRLRSDELLLISLGSTILRKHLDDVPLWRGDHVALRQGVEDFAPPPRSPGPGPGLRPPAPPPPLPPERRLRRFHGTVSLDPARVGRDASRIAEEVIAHLAGQLGAEVVVTLEIEARLPNGATDQIVRTVTENSRTLKFTSQGFEAE